MKLLTITHWSDLFQLRLQAESLRKNWLGSKRWTIVIEDQDPEIAAANLAWCQQNIHIDGWHIDFIVPYSPNCLHNGWERQQMFKLYYAATAEEDWALILDAKNFLVKPTDESFFLRENNSIPYLPRFIEDDFFKLTTAYTKQVLGLTADIPPAASMTPWVFNKKETCDLIKLLGIDLENWPVAKATEFTLYWHWTYEKFNWIPMQFVTGLWESNYAPDRQEFDVTVNEMVAGVETDDTIRFWTHHRYVSHPALRQASIDLLLKAGLDADVLQQWNREFQALVDNTQARRHQEFLKNRAGEDPGFDTQWYQ